MSVKLTHAQAELLGQIKRAGPKGITGLTRSPTLGTLERRGLVALLPKTSVRGPAWVLTDAGSRF